MGLLTSTGTIGGGLVLVGGLGSLSWGIAISAIGELALVGTIAMTGISAFGASCIMMFASNNRPGNNRVQNKQFEQAVRSAGYNPKDPIVRDALNEIHQYIRKNKLNLGWKKLLELIKEWLG